MDVLGPKTASRQEVLFGIVLQGPSTVKRTEKPYSPSTSGSKSMSCLIVVVFEKKIGHFCKNEGVCKWMSFVCQRLIQAFMSSTSFKILFSLFSDSDLGNSLRTVNVLRFLVDDHHHVTMVAIHDLSCIGPSIGLCVLSLLKHQECTP